VIVFAGDGELAGGAEEELETGDEVAEAVLGGDGVEGEAGAVVEDFKGDTACVLGGGDL
jgi:hypothetical protein